MEIFNVKWYFLLKSWAVSIDAQSREIDGGYREYPKSCTFSYSFWVCFCYIVQVVVLLQNAVTPKSCALCNHIILVTEINDIYFFLLSKMCAFECPFYFSFFFSIDKKMSSFCLVACANFAYVANAYLDQILL